MEDRPPKKRRRKRSKPLAPWSRRLLGSVLDGAIYTLAFWIPYSVFEGTDDSYLSLVIGVSSVAIVLAVQATLITRTGQSIAKRLLGMRIVHDDGSAVGLWSGVILRSWVVGGLTAIPYLGAVLATIDGIRIFADDRKCFHDVLAGTKVVTAR